LRPPQGLANMDRRIALPKASRPSIRSDFFLLSAAAVFFAPNILAGRSMTGGPHAQGPRGQWAGHFPLARPLARRVGPIGVHLHLPKRDKNGNIFNQPIPSNRNPKKNPHPLRVRRPVGGWTWARAASRRAGHRRGRAGGQERRGLRRRLEERRGRRRRPGVARGCGRCWRRLGAARTSPAA
jgi:hypothetical protein